jgi:hypothetical protein
MSDNIGLFDADGSMADYEHQLVKDMLVLQSPFDPSFDISQLWGDSAPPYLKARERVVKRQPRWWANLPPLQAGLFAYNLAEDIGFENRVLTQGPASNPAAWGEKVEWCQNWFGPEVSVTITRNKDNAYGKFLYDDYPPYLLGWLKNRPRGLGIMPMNRHNVGFEHPQVFRWDGADRFRLERVLRNCYERKSKEPLVIPE